MQWLAHRVTKKEVANGGEQALLPEYIPCDAFHSAIAHLDSIWFGETRKKKIRGGEQERASRGTV